MTDIKVITNLRKQNDGMYKSLVGRNIKCMQTNIDDILDITEQLRLLLLDNITLKSIVQLNKPLPIIKEKKELIIKEKIIIDDETAEESFEDITTKYTTIFNMDDMKRAFFNKEYDIFDQHVREFTLNDKNGNVDRLCKNARFYSADYKYISDKDGYPEYAVMNYLKGFTRNCSKNVKHYLSCIRCWRNNDEIKYQYETLWLVNAKEPLRLVIGDIYEDFEFIEIDETDFLTRIRKNSMEYSINNHYCIGEEYVH